MNLFGGCNMEISSPNRAAENRRHLLLILLIVVTPMLLYCHFIWELGRVPYLHLMRYSCYLLLSLSLFLGWGLTKRFAYAGFCFLLGGLLHLYMYLAPDTETMLLQIMALFGILVLPLGILFMGKGISFLLHSIGRDQLRKAISFLCYTYLLIHCLLFLLSAPIFPRLPAWLEYVLSLCCILGGFLALIGIIATYITGLHRLSKNTHLIKSEQELRISTDHS